MRTFHIADRRAVVVIEWGPMRSHKAAIAKGKRLRVGRFERADFVVSHDEELSGLHFELGWNGTRCTLRDLGSAHGTELNGERVAAGEVDHGDWIRAGNTVFSVYFEGQVPPYARAGAAARLSAELCAGALAALRAEQAPLFAVMDAARDERILTLLNASAERAQSLYEGAEAENLHDVAPYLVSLPKDSWLLERLVEEGWGDGWGIFLACRRPFKEVRQHLRRLLIAQVNETGEQLYFRFYDPGVLARTAAVCNPRQHQILFGDIEAFLVEQETGEMGGVSRISPTGASSQLLSG